MCHAVELIGILSRLPTLQSDIRCREATVLKQLAGHLVEPVQNWNQLRYHNFSEWMSASVHVSLLEAHAHCTVLAEKGQNPLCPEIVQSAQRPVLNPLKMLWLGWLTDYIVLRMDKHDIRAAKGI